MRLIKLGAAVLNQTPLDWQNNQRNIITALQTARAEQVSILCLPELCITGYGCEDAFQSPGVQRTAWQVLQELLPETSGLVVSLGLPLWHSNGLYNAAALVADGEIVGFVAKRHLAGDGIHYEPRWFKPWPAGAEAVLEVDGRSYPLGDLMFECGGIRIGFEICEDAWVPRRPGAELAQNGADVILNPSASHFAFDKWQVRRRFVIEGSRAFGVSYVYANLVGNEAGRAVYDGDAMIASGGSLLAHGPRLSFQDVLLTTAVVDVDITRMNRSRLASYAPPVQVDRRLCPAHAFAFPEVDPPGPQTPEFADWETSNFVKEEEFTRAVTLGLFDYMRKSRSRGFVVSLSGGADSAAVASLCALLVHFGLAELGPQAFAAKLQFWRNVAEDESLFTEPLRLIQRLLTCVYQSTRNSSEVTRSAAREVAQAWGAKFDVIDVDDIVQKYIGLAEEVLGRKLTWETDDIALQNIQARVRAPSVWMLANVAGALLLSTSNRSEAAVGYATMDGDTAGGLCPIAGIDKAFLRRWLRWMEEHGPVGIGPVPALAAINRQQPTAELRPLESAQTDEGDLMPYELLDAVERAAIRDKHMPIEIYLLMRARFPEYTPQQLAAWIERFFVLWSRNQWKRERYAPSLHLDDENLDPKTWCRFPILSGGFQRELAKLREFVANADQRRPK